MKREGKCQSEAFGGRWFLLFQNDAWPGSQGDLRYDNEAKQLPGMGSLLNGVIRAHSPTLEQSRGAWGWGGWGGGDDQHFD